MKHYPRVAIIGDLTVDTYVDSGDVKLGGAALNSAVWIKRLGAQPVIFSSLGSDQSASLFIQKIQKERIDSCIQKGKGSTSSIEIRVNAHGDRQYGVWDPGVLRQYHLRSSDSTQLSQADAVSVTVYPPYIHILDELRTLNRKSRTIINWGDMKEFESDLSVVESYMNVSDMCIFGLNKDTDEAMIRTLRQMAKTHHKRMIITLGAFGSLVYSDGEVCVQPAMNNSTVIDTTGAGDAFLAGFLVEYCREHDVQKSLALGARTAADAITRLGAY